MFGTIQLHVVKFLLIVYLFRLLSSTTCLRFGEWLLLKICRRYSTIVNSTLLTHKARTQIKSLWILLCSLLEKMLISFDVFWLLVKEYLVAEMALRTIEYWLLISRIIVYPVIVLVIYHPLIIWLLRNLISKNSSIWLYFKSLVVEHVLLWYHFHFISIFFLIG